MRRRRYSKPDKNTLKGQGFYQSRVWRNARRLALQRDNFLCQECLRNKRITPATEVHHKKELEDYPELALDLENLESLCWDCHEQTKDKAKKKLPKVRIIRP